MKRPVDELADLSVSGFLDKMPIPVDDFADLAISGFLDKKPTSMPHWGPDQRRFIADYLENLNWPIILNAENKRFICPACSKAGNFQL